MRFHEHIIRAAQAGDPEAISREALLQGITEFARHPEHFVDGLEASQMLSGEEVDESTGAISFWRQTVFGSHRFRERVTNLPGQGCRTECPAANGRAASAFVMTVEEPNKGDLFVRFCYEEEPRKSAEAEPEMLAELRKRAYEMKDRAVIETILSRFAEASGHRC